MSIIRFLQLNFIPRSSNLALLVLRLWLGLTMLLLHGLVKLQGYAEMSTKFPDPFGIGSKASLSLAIFAEVVCSILLILGLFTRFAALNLVVTMTVAFAVAHKAALTGPGNGELAFIYLAGYAVLLIAGAGRFSLDASLGSKR